MPVATDPETIRTSLSRAAGILHDRNGMKAAIAILLPMARSVRPETDPALVARSIPVAALDSQESRGAHHRNDYPLTNAALQARRSTTLQAVLGTQAYAPA